MSQNTLDTTNRDDNDVTPWVEAHLIPFIVSNTAPVLRNATEHYLTETVEKLSDYSTQPVTLSQFTETVCDEGRIRAFIIENQGLLHAQNNPVLGVLIMVLPEHISSDLREALEN